MIPPQNTNLMSFMEKYSVRTKMEINGKILEQVCSFKYIGRDMSLTVDCDVENKLNNFKHICGTIKRTL